MKIKRSDFTRIVSADKAPGGALCCVLTSGIVCVREGDKLLIVGDTLHVDRERGNYMGGGISSLSETQVGILSETRLDRLEIE